MVVEQESGRQVFKQSEECPIRDVVIPLGGKWMILVLFVLVDGSARFSEIRRRIEGISQRMLAQTLRQLEREGFVSRTVYPEVPVRVEYALTDLGRTLIKPLWGVVSWADTNHDTIRQSRTTYDREHKQP